MRSAAIVVLVTAFLACSDEEEAAKGAVDSPCQRDADCASGLICDAHGDASTCQEPHGHAEAASSSVTSAATGGGGSGGQGGSGQGGSGGEGGAVADACVAYCDCLATTCSSFNGYPYQEPGSCLTACAAASREELSCWGPYCEQASMAVSGVEHLCEHAWGAHGLDEC